MGVSDEAVEIITLKSESLGVVDEVDEDDEVLGHVSLSVGHDLRVEFDAVSPFIIKNGIATCVNGEAVEENELDNNYESIRKRTFSESSEENVIESLAESSITKKRKIDEGTLKADEVVNDLSWQGSKVHNLITGLQHLSDEICYVTDEDMENFSQHGELKKMLSSTCIKLMTLLDKMHSN